MLNKLGLRKTNLNKCYTSADESAGEIPAVYFDHLPAATTTTTTDSSGKFNIKIPKSGKYALAVRGSRKVFDSTETYFWLLPLEAAGEPKQIILTNNNMVGSKSPDPMIQFEAADF